MKMLSRPGQAALIVTLVVIVGLTVAVAVISRSVTDVGISVQEEERARSFSAAEAGIEDALRQDLSAIAGGNFQVGGPETTADYTVAKLSNFTAGIDPGQVITLDWTKGSAVSADINWSDNCAQLVTTQITADGSVTFDVSDSGETSAVISKGSNRLARIRFVGCSVDVAIESPPGTNLSFYDVDSIGISGQSTSRVKVIRSEPAAIGLMDFAVFSGGDIQ